MHCLAIWLCTVLYFTGVKMGFWNLKTKSVLIIDDFPQMRAMLSSMLKNYEPKEVHQAGNGKEALEKMSKHRFDIVLCDYNLGDGKDGQQVLEEAKYQKILPFYTLFIMVTAENTNAMVMGAAEHMPDAYLSKPINKTVLMSRMQKLLASSCHRAFFSCFIAYAKIAGQKTGIASFIRCNGK